MDLKSISVTMMVKNARATILDCLNSVDEFGEIVILENGSTDGTRELIEEFAASHPQVRLFYPEKFLGFGPMKNLAISHASHDWIFSIDADEILEPDALEEFRTLELEDDQVAAISRKNLYRGEWIKACGWYPDFVWRLFNKNKVRFTDAQVHECLIVDKSKVVNLKGHLRHYAFDGIATLLNKLQYYSGLWASQNLHREVGIPTILAHTLWSFIRNYLIKKGLLFGYRGFIISCCNALGVFFKYMKLYELKYARPTSVSLIVTTYNQKERLQLVLDSVRDLNPLPDEVLIADDGSTEDTAELIRENAKDFPCPLRHIWQEDQGFRAAKNRNNAIKAATSEYIIGIDGDILLERNFIADHLKYACRKQYLQGGRVLLTETETAKILADRKNGIHNSYELAFGKKSYKNRRNSLLSIITYVCSKQKADYFKKHDLIKGSRSCNMSFYKEDAEQCGLFDESFQGWGREDSDFVARFLFEIRGAAYRRLKFAGLAFHLHHPENSRADDARNYEKYLERVKAYREKAGK